MTNTSADKLTELKEQIELMKVYLLHKVDIEDWHGVYDSAIDIRCLAEKLDLLKSFQK